jgi:hypothetical protein
MDMLVEITSIIYYKFIGIDQLILLVITSCAHKNAHDQVVDWVCSTWSTHLSLYAP